MKSMHLVLLSALVLFGCKKEYDGQFQVYSPTTLNSTRDPITVQPGTYSSTLKVGKNEATVQIDLGGNVGKKKFVFNFPDDMQFPTGSGEFDLSSEETGQPYDMHGEIDQQVERSEPKRDRESCTYQRTEYQCYYDQYGRQVCGYYTRTYNGWREVEFYEVITTQDMKASLKDEAGKVTSVFSGENIEIERKYIHVGQCW